MPTPALKGVFTALITPFRDGSVDVTALGGLVDRQLTAGVDGLVPCGTTGESPTLDADEWTTIIGVCRDRAAGRVPVIAGCGTNATATSVQRAEALVGMGVDAGLLVLPYYNKPNPAGLLGHVRAVAATGLPLVLYHVPGRTAQHLPATQLAELCAVPGVVGVKEATGDISYGLRLLELTTVAVLSGDDFTFAALSAFGGSGVISVISNIAPAMTVALDRAARSGDLVAARELQFRLQPAIRALFSSTNPVPCKAALADLGLCRNELRLPLAAMELDDPTVFAGLR